MSLKLAKIAVAVAAAAALCLVPTATSAQRIMRGDLIAGSSGTADPQQGVYVRDSAIAADKFELGKRMERLKEWHKSADVYQEILEKYQDRVVPTATNEKGQTIQYASVTVAVQERLAKWPEEGLNVYRNRFEPVAGTRLEQARPNNLQDLHEIFATYFVTDAARTAGIRLMDLYMEAGEFSAAAWLGDRLLAWHPSLATERPQVLFRTATAYHLAGNANHANRLAEELKGKHGDELATVAGKEVPLSEAIAAQFQQRPPIASGAGGTSWRTFGGDETRNLLINAGGHPGARIYSIDLPGPITTGLNEQMRDGILRPYENARSLGQTINVMPVVDRGELFFHDGWRVYGLHLESGVPLSGWAQSYPSRNGQYWINAGNNINFELVNASAAMLPTQNTLTLTDDAVLAVMGQQDARMNAAIAAGQMNVDAGGTRLVCLDRATGRERWTATPRVNAQDQANVRNLAFGGSPLVVGENVYVIARGSSGAGVEECHVYCYALHGGEFKWSSYIASSQTGFFQMGGMPAMLDNDTLSHLAFASGRIFVLTNLGAVAAIDAYSGATAWLTIYPRDEVDQVNARQRILGGAGFGGVANIRSGGASTRPWEFNPAIVSDGKVFVLPTDSRYVLVYDAGSGREIKRISRDLAYNNVDYRVTMLLGVSAEKLFLAGSPQSQPSSFWCLDWAKADPQKQDPRTLVEESILYFSQPPPIKGRPFLTATHLALPTESALRIMHLNPEDMGRSRTVYSYPEGQTWPAGAGEGPGNVVVTPDHVIVANERNVSVYTDLKSVHEKLKVALDADPGSVAARLVFAEIMFNAGQFADASKVMDEAIDLLGGLRSMRPGSYRDRIFSDMILFAQRVAANKTNENVVRADGLYNRAAYAAHTVSQQVHYRLSRARFIESVKDVVRHPDYATAVRLYQEILSDPEMRAITLAGEQGGPTQAGKVAEAAITELIRKVGRNVYQPFEQEAAAALKALADTTDANQLLALSEQYPHASAATQALMQAAQVYEQQNQPRMATLVLRRLYSKFYDRSTNPERAKLAEAMARNYLKVGNYGAALGRLQRISKLLPNAPLTSPLETPDGRTIAKGERPARTVSEAAEALEQFVRQLAPETLPDVKLPPPLTLEERMARKRIGPPFENHDPQQHVLAGVQAILEPPAELSEHVREDRMLVWSNGRLLCLAGATTQPKWTSNAVAETPAAIAWIDDGENVLVWGEGEAALVNAENGNAVWRLELKGVPAAELVVPDAPANEGAVAPAAAAARRPDGAQAALQEQQRALQARLQAQQEMELRVAMLQQQQQLAIRGGRVVPQPALQPAQQPPHDGKERVLHVRPLTDRILFSTTTGRILAIDARDGRVIWQTRLSNNPRAIQQTLANDDFTVVRMTESPVWQIVVLDSFSGQLILRKRFAGTQPGWPINCALSPDGTLVWTTATSMAAKDLYEPGDAPTWERPNGSYANMTQPDQLVIWNQQILAVCNGGQFVACRSLRSGDDVPDMQMLQSGNNDATTRLRLSGPRLYVVSDKSMIGYHLEQGTNYRATLYYPSISILGTETMVTKDYVVLPALRKPEPTEPQQDLNQIDRYLLMAYSRALVTNPETGKQTESGLQVHRYDFREPAKVKAFHATEGGIFYLAGDDRLHLLKGSRK